MFAADSLLLTLRKRHRMAAAQLLGELAVSRPTLMRAVRAAGTSVLTVGRARRTSYAARRLLRGSESPLPVFRVDPHGGSEQAGRLHLAYPDGCVFEYAEALEWPLDRDMREGWFEGVPYPLQDLRPEGFLGRAFARQNAAVLQVSEDPRAWSDDDTLYALSLLGADLGGNFIVGEASYRRWLEQLQRPLAVVTDVQVEQTYPVRAQSAMQQGVAGSSAGGEFPKFTAVRELDGMPVHVIVKFSGSDESPGTERWSDLLVCEHLAADGISRLPGLVASTSSIRRAGGRTFLEVLRFDRHGARGRSPLCSWAAVNQGWFGRSGRPWTEGAAQLLERGLIDAGTRDAVARLWHYGQLIGNSDMHDGNLSFVPGAPALRLAPVYDMLPMRYAPQRGVELPEIAFAPRLPLPAEREPWQEAAQAAIAFWSRASDDTRISNGFRQTCGRNAQLVRDAALLGSPGHAPG
jgi:hypothetical protein